MKFTAEIDIMPLENLLDPQGKAVLNVLHNLGYSQVEKLRMGKHVKLIIEAADAQEANSKVDEICKKVLINPVVEQYVFTLKEE
jgi:phosphoribosylformylglycinamidine synthase